MVLLKMLSAQEDVRMPFRFLKVSVGFSGISIFCLPSECRAAEDEDATGWTDSGIEDGRLSLKMERDLLPLLASCRNGAEGSCSDQRSADI